MNPMTRFKMVYANLLILMLILISAFTIQSNVAFAAIGDPPTIKITSPVNNVLLSDIKAIISGTFTNVRLKNLLFTAYEAGDPDTKISNSNTNAADWNIDNTNKIWTFTKRLSEGKHNLKIEIKDTATNAVETSSVTLYISGTGIVLPDKNLLYGDDLTNIPQNAKIIFTFVDDKPIAQIDPTNAIKVMQGEKPVLGKATLHDLRIPGITAYSIIFEPDNLLSLNKSFTAKIEPSAVGDSTNKVFAKSFKFTTKTNADWEDYNDSFSKTSSNPHGHYTSNTNMCATCHSSHNGSTASLELKPDNDATENYCMACHDGTLNAPIIDNSESKNHHTARIDIKQQETCTTCHNPHLNWKEENPNLLKDHYVYKHNKADLNQRGLTDLKVDSLNTSCINCHEESTALDTASNTYKSIFDSETFKQGYYEFLQYKKSLTADGSMDNYSLCLSCHTDIKKYYKDGIQTQHSITAADGSKLNGFIPCAECHETHGSNNSFLLKSQFGHDNQAEAFSFTGDSKSWDVNAERQFCLKCHNGATSIYGVVGKALSPEYHPSQTAACSLCHGTGALNRDRILSAAHGPKYVPLSDPLVQTQSINSNSSTTTSESNMLTNESTTPTNPTDSKTNSSTSSSADTNLSPTDSSSAKTD